MDNFNFPQQHNSARYSPPSYVEASLFLYKSRKFSDFLILCFVKVHHILLIIWPGLSSKGFHMDMNAARCSSLGIRSVTVSHAPLHGLLRSILQIFPNLFFQKICSSLSFTLHHHFSKIIFYSYFPHGNTFCFFSPLQSGFQSHHIIKT